MLNKLRVEIRALVSIQREQFGNPKYISDRSVKSLLSCTIRKRTKASEWTIPRYHLCQLVSPSAMSWFWHKVICIFLESTNTSRRLQFTTTADLHLYTQEIRSLIHWMPSMKYHYNADRKQCTYIINIQDQNRLLLAFLPFRKKKFGWCVNE